MRVDTIIVGTDGTDWSKAAVRWAARESQHRGSSLRVTHAYDWEWREARSDPGYNDQGFAGKHAEGVVAASVQVAREAVPELKIEADPVIGHAAAQLLAEARPGGLIVVGSRGRGGFSSLLLGSVSQRVATHAPCSVVVVRGRGDVTEGPVVAGVDDSPAADGVLAAAFEAATARGCELEVRRSFLPAVPLGLAKWPAVEVSTPEADANELADLEALLAPWRAKYPDLPVKPVLSHRGIASELVEASRRAQLVMVGSHGHGVIAGSLLGSAGLQLLHHSDCPVYIVRPAT
jgi:nucleotide-binding universal stress UspA family protein